MAHIDRVLGCVLIHATGTTAGFLEPLKDKVLVTDAQFCIVLFGAETMWERRDCRSIFSTLSSIQQSDYWKEVVDLHLKFRHQFSWSMLSLTTHRHPSFVSFDWTAASPRPMFQVFVSWACFLSLESTLHAVLCGVCLTFSAPALCELRLWFWCYLSGDQLETWKHRDEPDGGSLSRVAPLRFRKYSACVGRVGSYFRTARLVLWQLVHLCFVREVALLCLAEYKVTKFCVLRSLNSWMEGACTPIPLCVCACVFGSRELLLSSKWPTCSAHALLPPRDNTTKETDLHRVQNEQVKCCAPPRSNWPPRSLVEKETSLTKSFWTNFPGSPNEPCHQFCWWHWASRTKRKRGYLFSCILNKTSRDVWGTLLWRAMLFQTAITDVVWALGTKLLWVTAHPDWQFSTNDHPVPHSTQCHEARRVDGVFCAAQSTTGNAADPERHDMSFSVAHNFETAFSLRH